MQTVTIPKKLTKGEELIIISRREFEEYLRITSMISKDQLWFWTKEWQEKEKQADKDIEDGNISHSYKTVKELRKALNNLKK